MKSLLPDLPVRKGITRKPASNYSADAIFFVTFKVHRNNCFLGQVIGGVVHTSAEGEIVEMQWQWLASQYPYVILHKLTVMPDHVHAIIEIDHEAGVGYDLSLQCKIKPLSELIGAFKTTSTKKIRQDINPKFEWQRSFHDHIIRNEREYNLITEYMQNNPLKWEARRDARRDARRNERRGNSHGINPDDGNVGTGRDPSVQEDGNVGTGRDLSVQEDGNVGTGRDPSVQEDGNVGTGRDLSVQEDGNVGTGRDCPFRRMVT